MDCGFRNSLFLHRFFIRQIEFQEIIMGLTVFHDFPVALQCFRDIFSAVYTCPLFSQSEVCVSLLSSSFS